MKYRFTKINIAQDVIRDLGFNIPPADVIIHRPAKDDEGNYVADMEIDFGKHTLSVADERKLEDLMKNQGLKLGGKQWIQ